MDIVEILAKARAPERTVALCLDADLAAEHDALNRQLLDAQHAGAVTMGDTGKAVGLAQRIRDIEEQMSDSQATFRMRGLSAFKRDEWLTAHPGREGKGEAFNVVTGPPALIAAACIDPIMTVEQAVALCEQLGLGQTDVLFNAAWEATSGGGAVPFSVAASATLRALAPKPG